MHAAVRMTTLLLMLSVSAPTRWSTVSASPELDVFSEDPDVTGKDREDHEGWDAGFIREGQGVDDALSRYESTFWGDSDRWLTGGEELERTDPYGGHDAFGGPDPYGDADRLAEHYDPVSGAYDWGDLDGPMGSRQGYYRAVLDVRDYNDNSPAVTCHGKCLCRGTTVDCSGQNLTAVPRGISPDTTRLDLSMNNLTELHVGDFVNMTNLRELRLVGNKLTFLPKNLFLNNVFLQMITLQGNRLTNVPARTFRNLFYLQQLFLDSNMIQYINKSAFENLRSLTLLCLNANQLTEVPVEALRKVPSLQALAINSNNITELTNRAFVKNGKLILLQLANNKISRIEDQAFLGLSRLKVLELNDNEINRMPAALFHLSSLEELNLENNSLIHIPDKSFLNKTRLNTLKISHNPLKSVGEHAFINLPLLEGLKLSEIRIMSKFPNLTGTTNLRQLALDRASIESIPNDICLHLKKLTYFDVHTNKIETLPDMSQCKNITVLNLAHNQIKSLEGRPFHGLDQLIDLILDKNSIVTIPRDAFSGLESLEYLNLAYNQIKEIHPDAFLPLKSLKDLNIGSNNLRHLPTAGLINLEKLKVFKNPYLREFPMKEHFPKVNNFFMSYAYHCCDFINSRPEQIYLDMIREYVIWMTDGEPDQLALWEKYENQSRMWAKTFGENMTIENGKLLESVGGDMDLAKFDSMIKDSTQTEFDKSQPYYVVAKAAITCKPMPDAFMPCDDLFGWWSLRCGVWFVFMLALLGNGVVFFVSVTSKTKMDVPRFLICNLAMADFFMGIYLGILAIMDASTLGQFKKYAIQWQMSAGCLVAGVLGVLSSELSVFTLTVITLERFYAITHAMQLNKRLSLKHAGCIMLGGWLWSFGLAMLPLFGISDYRKFAVCLPFEIEDVLSKSYVCFIMVFNGISFFIILGCYLIMYISIRDSQAWNSNDTRVAKRMALLVFTDFLCWAPIAILSLAAAFGKNLIHLNEAKVLTIFILPLNSCANPFLYAFFTKQFKKDCVLLCRRLEDSSIARHFSQASQRHPSLSWKHQRRPSALHSLMGEGKSNHSQNVSSGSNSFGLVNYNSDISSGMHRDIQRDTINYNKYVKVNSSRSVISVSGNGGSHKYRYKICPGEEEDRENFMRNTFVESYRCNECSNRDAHIILHQDFYSNSGSDTYGGTDTYCGTDTYGCTDTNGGTSETDINDHSDKFLGTGSLSRCEGTDDDTADTSEIIYLKTKQKNLPSVPQHLQSGKKETFSQNCDAKSGQRKLKESNKLRNLNHSLRVSSEAYKLGQESGGETSEHEEIEKSNDDFVCKKFAVQGDNSSSGGEVQTLKGQSLEDASRSSRDRLQLSDSGNGDELSLYLNSDGSVQNLQTYNTSSYAPCDELSKHEVNLTTNNLTDSCKHHRRSKQQKQLEFNRDGNFMNQGKDIPTISEQTPEGLELQGQGHAAPGSRRIKCEKKKHSRKHHHCHRHQRDNGEGRPRGQHSSDGRPRGQHFTSGDKQKPETAKKSKIRQPDTSSKTNIVLNVLPQDYSTIDKSIHLRYFQLSSSGRSYICKSNSLVELTQPQIQEVKTPEMSFAKRRSLTPKHESYLLLRSRQPELQNLYDQYNEKFPKFKPHLGLDDEDDGFSNVPTLSFEKCFESETSCPRSRSMPSTTVITAPTCDMDTPPDDMRMSDNMAAIDTGTSLANRNSFSSAKNSADVESGFHSEV